MSDGARPARHRWKPWEIRMLGLSVAGLLVLAIGISGWPSPIAGWLRAGPSWLREVALLGIGAWLTTVAWAVRTGLPATRRRR